jgi:hypothetical protein
MRAANLPPAPEPLVVGEHGTVLFATGGVGRAAVAGDVWEIHYPHDLPLHAAQEVHVVGQRADVLLVLPASTPTYRHLPQHRHRHRSG